MRILTWNLGLNGAPARRVDMDLTQRFVRRLEQKDADVMVLIELGRQPTQLVEELTKRWTHVLPDPRSEPANELLIVSRFPLEPLIRHPAGPPDRERWIEASVPALGISLTAVHVPSAKQEDNAALTRKNAFWRGLLTVAADRVADSHILIGDFNTGENQRDRSAGGKPFSCTDHLEHLKRNWTDLWREEHPERTPDDFTYWSWSRLKKLPANGFRIDHVYVSPALRGRWCIKHDHTVRDYWHNKQEHVDPDRRLSDHSIVVAKREQ